MILPGLHHQVASALSISPWPIRREVIVALASRFSLDANALNDEVDSRLDLWRERGMPNA